MCFRYKNAYFVSEKVDFSRFQIQCSSDHKVIHQLVQLLDGKEPDNCTKTVFMQLLTIFLLNNCIMIIISSGFIYKMIKGALLFFSIKR